MNGAQTLQQLPLYGRYYKLTIKFPQNDNGQQTVLTVTDSSFEPEGLRIKFDISTQAWSAFWWADIEIYNLDQATTNQIIGNAAQTPSGIKQGMEVILEAGYQNGNKGVIWDGFVFQPLWDRENVVDFKITLRCVIGLAGTRNFINQSYGQISQAQLVQKMANDCFRSLPAPSSQISSSINDKPSPRAITVFGNPMPRFDEIAEDNNMMTWLSDSGLNMASLNNDVSPLDQGQLIEYTPETGIVGTPQQTQVGINMRVLLDPRLKSKKPLQQFRINNTVIQQQKKQINVFPGLLDQDGQYIVLGVRHIGDTRGNDWYTEVTGLTSAGGKAALLEVIGAQVSQ